MKNPLVSIVVPTYNRKKSLVRLVESIYKSTYKNFEIIVIDDASSDGTYSFIAGKYARRKNFSLYRNSENLFAAGSRNEGIKKSSGELIFFIDDDNVIDKMMIESMVRIFEHDSRIGEVGPVNYSFKNKRKILWAGTKRNMWTTKTSQLRDITDFSKSETWETDDVLNAYLVNASLFKRKGLRFDTRYGIMYEESDLAYSIRRMGYKIVVVKKAKIYHDAERIVNGKYQDYFYHFMNDPRRLFVFARNRLVFHSRYSSSLQLIFICTFWTWFFCAYYFYKIMFYRSYPDFAMQKKVSLAIKYLYGSFTGLMIVFKLKRL